MKLHCYCFVLACCLATGSLAQDSSGGFTPDYTRIGNDEATRKQINDSARSSSSPTYPSNSGSSSSSSGSSDTSATLAVCGVVVVVLVGAMMMKGKRKT